MSREYFKGSNEEERSYSPAVKVTGGVTVTHRTGSSWVSPW